MQKTIKNYVVVLNSLCRFANRLPKFLIVALVCDTQNAFVTQKISGTKMRTILPKGIQKKQKNKKRSGSCQTMKSRKIGIFLTMTISRTSFSWSVTIQQMTLSTITWHHEKANLIPIPNLV